MLETTTDAAGAFRFEGLDTDPALAYAPEVEYLQVPYRSDPLRFEAGQTSLAATLPVYETTTDDGTIRLDSVHMIAESFGQVLRITEIHLFGNSGDRTYVGADSSGVQSATLFIPLPADAVGLAFGQDTPPGRFVEVEGGLMDTQPVPPGQEASLAFFSYHLPVSGDTVPLERRFAYPVTTLNVLVAQPGLTLQSSQLAPMGTRVVPGPAIPVLRYDRFGRGRTADDGIGTGGRGCRQPGHGELSARRGASAASAPVDQPAGGLALARAGLALLAVGGAVVYAQTTRRSALGPVGRGQSGCRSPRRAACCSTWPSWKRRTRRAT